MTARKGQPPPDLRQIVYTFLPDPSLSHHTMPKKIPITVDMVRCSTCMLSGLCLPLGLTRTEVEQLDELIKERIRLSKGAALYALGERCDAIYALRFGSIKTQIEDTAGQAQITGFLLPGEILGMSSLAGDRQSSHAIALEDSEVCVMRLQDLDHLSQQLPALQQQFRRLMIQEINRSHRLIIALGSLRAERRLAAFLLNLSQRLSVLGYSASEFILRMSREEIGNHLGLTLETVSRMFTRFAKEGLIRIQKQREIRLLDLPALQALSGLDWVQHCGTPFSDLPRPRARPDAASTR